MLARERHHGPEQLADAVLGAGRTRPLQVTERLPDARGRRAGRLGRSRAIGAALERLRAQERRRGAGDRVQRRGRAVLPAGRSLGRLDLVPAVADRLGIGRALVSEDVRMAADHLQRGLPDDLLQRELPGLLRHRAVHQDLDEEISELLAQARGVARVDGLGDLVALLQQVAAQRLVRLVPVPGAAARGVEPLDDGAQGQDGAVILLGGQRRDEPGPRVVGKEIHRRLPRRRALDDAGRVRGRVARGQERARLGVGGGEYQQRPRGVQAGVRRIEGLHALGRQTQQVEQRVEGGLPVGARGVGRHAGSIGASPADAGRAGDRMGAMVLARWGATALFLLALPLFLVLSNVRIAANELAVYRYAFDRYGAEERTGVARADLDRAARDIVLYFRDDRDLLDIRVAIDGQEQALFNPREVLHMRDVKGLMGGAFSVQELSLAYVVGYIAVVYLWARERSLRHLARLVALGGALTLAALALATAAVVAGFDDLFRRFHVISFSNDLWKLDPDRDRLIQMFPQGFWFDATLGVGLLTIAEAALLLASAAGYLLYARRRRRPRGRLGPPAGVTAAAARGGAPRDPGPADGRRDGERDGARDGEP